MTMNVYQLYDNIAKARDQYKASYSKFYFELCNDIFLQMLDVVFKNERKKDELPRVFHITTNLLSRNIKTLMEDVGLAVSVERLFWGGLIGSKATYRITQI